MHVRNGYISLQNALDKVHQALRDHYFGTLDTARYSAWFKTSWDSGAKSFRDRCTTKRGKDLANCIVALGVRAGGFLVKRAEAT